MTDEQINQRIAEVCGWNNEPVVRTDGKGRIWVTNWPDYCANLNAMHEAEKTIFPYYATVYSNKLAKVTGAEVTDDTDYFCATARQRAEAFLRTLGRWEEETAEKSSVDHLCDPTKMMERKQP